MTAGRRRQRISVVAQQNDPAFTRLSTQTSFKDRMRCPSTEAARQTAGTLASVPHLPGETPTNAATPSRVRVGILCWLDSEHE